MISSILGPILIPHNDAPIMMPPLNHVIIIGQNKAFRQQIQAFVIERYTPSYISLLSPQFWGFCVNKASSDVQAPLRGVRDQYSSVRRVFEDCATSSSSVHCSEGPSLDT
ncbi:hypothetical protein VN97_g1790 [Penicillium thymicola]|uniref:Uncharacterized protein n=1 Tax=Penicillium thymicola TaxID=293382 RepID=A0AAI9XCD3_PENTH|nr:hypothetical protein VN97_g1790 [Penicillium thymicola]